MNRPSRLVLTLLAPLSLFAACMQIAESVVSPLPSFAISEAQGDAIADAGRLISYESPIFHNGLVDTDRRAPLGALKPVDPISFLEDIPTWEREIGFISTQNDKRQALMAGNRVISALLSDQVTSPEDSVASATKVLVVGDSYVWGFGSANLENVWSRRLQVELSERHGAGSWAVDQMGAGGRSFYDYAEWLSSAAVESIDPDAIVIGYLSNDISISGFEQALCPNSPGELSNTVACNTGSGTNLSTSYIECINGRESTVVSNVVSALGRIWPRVARWALDRHCSTHRLREQAGLLREDAIARDPSLNPYAAFFDQAMERIIDSAGGRPVFVLPSARDMDDLAAMQPYLDLMVANGFHIVGSEHTTRVFGSASSKKDTWVNTADGHPGPPLARAYAADTADKLIEFGLTPGPDRVEPPAMEVVSNYLPISLATVGSPGGGRLFHNPDSPSDAENFAAGTQSMRGEATPAQFASCALIGRPHATFGLNPERLTPSSKVRITLRDVSTDALVITLVSYKTSWRPELVGATVLQRGQSIVLQTPPGTSEILVATTHAGCPLDAEIRMPGFTLVVQPS